MKTHSHFLKTRSQILKTRSQFARRVLLYLLPVVTFVIGLLIPSPIWKSTGAIGDEDNEAVVDTTNMRLPDGSVYDGSVIKGTTTRHGYGRLTTADNTTFEGKWRDDVLPYGQKTSVSSVYKGRFDKHLNIDGFGIIKYSDSYINGKKKQGMADSEIVSMYIGNWRKNNKHGLGRVVYIDNSMAFGEFSEGLLKKTAAANYRVGGNVYGIDVSHHQPDINWNNLALYCDKDGNVFHGRPATKTFMQPVFFVYIKATEGATIKDNTYSIRAIEAERHGMLKGAYHFLRLGSPIDEQVKNFLETAAWTQGDMPPALDVEVEQEIKKYGVATLQKMTLAWLEQVEAATHVRPIIYTRESIRNAYLSDSRFKKYDFWIARYSDKGPSNFDWHLWQMTEKGVVNGYSGHIDINLFKGDYSALMKFVGTP